MKNFRTIVTLTFVGLMLVAIAIIADADHTVRTGLSAWWERVNEQHAAVQAAAQAKAATTHMPHPARPARSARREAADTPDPSTYEHGHLATTTIGAFRQYGYASRDVLLAIRLDTIPAESTPMSYTVMSRWRGRVMWTGKADANGWMLLPIPVDCTPGVGFAKVERVVVYAPNRYGANMGRVVYDGMPAELVRCN